MNIVRARRIAGFGQASSSDFPMYYDPGLITAEETPGTGPVFTDPSITYGPGSGAPPISYAPAPAVPQPPSPPAPAVGPQQTGFTFPAGTVAALYPQGVPSPAPRVNVPATGIFASSMGGIPMIAWLAIIGVGVLVLSGGGRRR
jgi:hypothetical protein